MTDIADWQTFVTRLGLLPHPEGGYYRETFRSGRSVSVDGATRCAATVIHYLLAEDAYSAWHRIDADETWYFHAGGPLAVHVLSPGGDLRTHRLGNPMAHAGAAFQATVSAGCWFAAELLDHDGYALVSCSVSPGFEFSGFELAAGADMETAVQRHGAWVARLLASASASSNP